MPDSREFTDSEALDLYLTRGQGLYGPSRTIVIRDGGVQGTLVYEKGVGITEMNFSPCDQHDTQIFNLSFTDPEEFNVVE